MLKLDAFAFDKRPDPQAIVFPEIMEVSDGEIQVGAGRSELANCVNAPPISIGGFRKGIGGFRRPAVVSHQMVTDCVSTIACRSANFFLCGHYSFRNPLEDDQGIQIGQLG